MLQSALPTTKSKAVRFLVTLGIGFTPLVGLFLGPVASAIDKFLLEKVLPKSGLIAFLSRLYPSIF